MKTEKIFTKEEGLRTQKRQMKKWRKVLNQKCYSLLLIKAKSENKKLLNMDGGFDVFRGSSIDMFIENLKNNL